MCLLQCQEALSPIVCPLMVSDLLRERAGHLGKDTVNCCHLPTVPSLWLCIHSGPNSCYVELPEWV